MSTAAKTAGRVEALIDLQLAFSAAEEEMNRAWLIYRDKRPDAAALDTYTTAMNRCQDLKTRIHQFKVAGRAA